MYGARGLFRGPSLLRITLWHLVVLLLFTSILSLIINVLLTRSSYAETDGVLTSLTAAITDILRSGLSESGLDELAARDAVRELRFEGYTLAIYDDYGNLLAERPARSNAVQLSDLPPADGKTHIVSVRSPNERTTQRVAKARIHLEPVGRSYVIVASRSFDSPLRALAARRRVILTYVPLAVLLAALASFYLMRATFAPALKMSQQALRMSASDLAARFPVTRSNGELNQLAANFNGLLERLDTSFESQRRFMADASHELRTPLSVIGTTTAVMLETTTSSADDLRDALRIIRQEGNRLRRVVEDMFYLAQADSGTPILRNAWLQLDEVLLETVRSVGQLARAKQVRIHFESFEEAKVFGDEDLLRRVFVNLLANAVKYSSQGGLITVGLDRHDDSGQYRVRIANDGDEIAPADRDRIFDRFYRVLDGNTGATEAGLTGGAGLGLAIARSIAELHGGHLKLESSGEKGSVFVCLLPIPK